MDDQVSIGFQVLETERDRAERFLNRVRIVVLVALAIAAVVYAPSLSPALNRVNLIAATVPLAWALLQVPLFFRRTRLPTWLRLANPVVDLTAVTMILGGYGLAATPGLALQTPILAAYFVILAALPVASSTRKALFVSVLVLVEYGALIAWFATQDRLHLVMDPVQAGDVGGVSPLDLGARLLLLACAGAVATYATRWQERLTQRYADSTGHSAQLKSRLARTELQALKLQLQPHFLFNTLNTITSLVHRDPGRAERMVSGLSELLRVSLGSAGEQEVTVSRELEVLQHYVDIQQVRFEDRLTVTIAAEPEAQGAAIPNLMLQPLVENAIKHGLASRVSGGNIRVDARRHGQWLQLVVEDNGVGEADPEGRREGVGLSNTRARLRQLYGDDHQFVAGGTREGFRVAIALPYRVLQRDRSPGGGRAA